MRFQNQGLKTGSFAVTHGRTPIIYIYKLNRNPKLPAAAKTTHSHGAFQVELLPERPESLSALSREEVNLHHVLGTGEGRWDLPQAVPTRLISLNLVETHGFSGSGSSGFQKPWWCVSGIPNYGPPKYPVCRCPIFFKGNLQVSPTFGRNQK